MSNRSLILILLIVFSGCSAVKTGKSRIVNKSLILTGDIGETRKNNLSKDDFNILRADVVSKINEEEQKFIASFKYKSPGIWLLSIKSNTGIEAARAWISADTVLINDRLSKKLYYGESNALDKKYGIPVKAMPVLIGDFIEEEKMSNEPIQCIEGMNEIIAKLENVRIEYVISCKDNKVISSKIISPGKNDILISYSKIQKIENRKYPAKILIRDPEEKIVIEIKIRKIDFNNIEKMDFIPGKGYEKILVK